MLDSRVEKVCFEILPPGVELGDNMARPLLPELSMGSGLVPYELCKMLFLSRVRLGLSEWIQI